MLSFFLINNLRTMRAVMDIDKTAFSIFRLAQKLLLLRPQRTVGGFYPEVGEFLAFCEFCVAVVYFARPCEEIAGVSSSLSSLIIFPLLIFCVLAVVANLLACNLFIEKFVRKSSLSVLPLKQS